MAKLRPTLLPLPLLLCIGAAISGAQTVVPPPLTSPPAMPAPQSVSPFTIVGFLQQASLDKPGDVLSGGTMVVNGHTIVVPRNALVSMGGEAVVPTRLFTWAELFSLAPAPWGPTQTGLALSDLPKPLTTYEFTVQGNRVISGGKDQYIAGLIFISQQSINTSQGFINYIDYRTGEMRIGHTPGDPANSARVILNDPIGRFGRVNSPDVRFSIDESNPTVRTATGYPMCVPRINPSSPPPPGGIPDDPLCPQVNRPKDPADGTFLSVFTFPPPPCAAFPPLPTGAPSIVPPNCVLNPPAASPDVTQQMPFEVGDYVTYSGTLVADTTSPGCTSPGTSPAPASPPDPICQYISAWSVIADIGAFTAPGIMPAYVGVDLTLMGTGGLPAPTFPQEAVVRAKVIGFTTDPSNLVDIYGIDIDPCTGARKDRYWATQVIEQTAKKGRFQFQPNGGLFIPPVREVRVVSRTLSGGTSPPAIDSRNTFANGLVAGQYVAPMMSYIFPENLEVFQPPVPLNLQDFPFLAQGSGPWPGFAPTPLPWALSSFPTGLTAGQFMSDPGPIVSQLSPWPGLNAPPATLCAPADTALAPVANAGVSRTVVAGSTVQLDGTASLDPNVPPDLPLNFSWTQTSGTPVTLSGANSATPTFIAPLLPDKLTFSLTVVNTAGVASVAPATVTITITASPTLVVSAGTAQTVDAGVLVQLAGAVSDPNATVLWTQNGGPSVTLTGANTLTPSFTAPTAQILATTDLVFQLTATSSTQGTASAIVTITVKPKVDAIFLEVVYQTSKARLSITASSTAPAGTAVMTADFAGQTIQLPYFPSLNAYLAFVVGIPNPKLVTVKSSLGGSATRFVIVQP